MARHHFSAVLVAVALLSAESALACFTDIYLTRVIGWDATSRSFVVERKHTYACASCTCAAQGNALRIISAKQKTPTIVPLDYDDGCGAAFSILRGEAPPAPEPPEPDDVPNAAGDELRSRFALGQKQWPKAKPIVERAVLATFYEQNRDASFGLSETESLELVVRVEGRTLTRKELDTCAAGTVRPSDAAIAEGTCWRAAGTGPRTIALERHIESKKGATVVPVASFEWTPTCTERGCDQLRFFWAPDGSALAIVAGAVMAEMEAVPDHGPHMQPADVVVIDVTAKPVAVHRDGLRVKSLN